MSILRPAMMEEDYNKMLTLNETVLGQTGKDTIYLNQYSTL